MYEVVVYSDDGARDSVAHFAGNTRMVTILNWIEAAVLSRGIDQPAHVTIDGERYTWRANGRKAGLTPESDLRPLPM